MVILYFGDKPLDDVIIRVFLRIVYKPKVLHFLFDIRIKWICMYRPMACKSRNNFLTKILQCKWINFVRKINLSLPAKLKFKAKDLCNRLWIFLFIIFYYISKNVIKFTPNTFFLLTLSANDIIYYTDYWKYWTEEFFQI